MRRAFVISPFYNCKRYVKASVLSVTDNLSTYPQITHVMVDDVSQDGTWERLQEDDIRGTHQVIIRNKEHLSSAVGSFMAGVSYVRDRFDPHPDDVVFWLDGDDWLIGNDAIKKMMVSYERNPEVEMCYSDHIVWLGTDAKGPQTGSTYSRSTPDRTMYRYGNVAYSHLRSFQWHMLEQVDGWRLVDKDGKPWKFAGDSALFLPMLEVAKRVKYIQEPLYAYNMERADNEAKKDPSKQQRASVRVRDQMPNTNNRPDVWPEAQFAPVRRFKLDHGRICNIECRGCYYLHQKPWRNKTLKEIEDQIRAGRQRGCRACDISGGEPTIAKELPRWIEMCRLVGLLPGIITHGQDLYHKLPALWDAGLGDILFSVHGDRERHNWWTKSEKRDGYGRVRHAMERCSGEGFGFRTNTVLWKNYDSLPRMAMDLAEVRPYVSNFINWNAYYEWGKEEATFQAKISDIAPRLKEAIDIMTSNGTMVNVRYFPFCALKGYEKHIVNMHQVMFDPYEWDYNVMPKTFKRYREHGCELASGTNSFSPRCMKCGMMNTVCSGVNTVYLKHFGDDELEPYEEVTNDPFFFRSRAEPGQLYTFAGHNYGWFNRRMQSIRERAAQEGSGGLAESAHGDPASVSCDQHEVHCGPA